MNMARLFRDYKWIYVDQNVNTIRFKLKKDSHTSGIWLGSRAFRNWGSWEAYMNQIKSEQDIK